MSERPILLQLTLVARVRQSFGGRRSRRADVLLTAGVVVVLVLSIVIFRAWRSTRPPTPVGNPDPGHRLLNTIRTVATAVPVGARVLRSSFDEPHWDSCDGIRSSYGWDPATVDIGFLPHRQSDTEVFSHISAALVAQGWSFDTKSPAGGAWYWNRQIDGEHAWIQLLAGGGVDAREWDLQANAEPVTHPSGGC